MTEGAAGRPPGADAERGPDRGAPGARLGSAVLVAALGLSGCGNGDGGKAARGVEAAPVDADTLPAWCRKLPRPAYDTLDLAFEAEGGWFRVYRIRPGVHAIYEPHQFQEVISYLIEGTDRALLFDTGMGIAPIRPVAEAVTDLPVTVFNSHTHPDHVGGNHEFDRVLGMETDYSRAHAREGFSNDRMRGQVAPDALCRPPPAGTDPGTYEVQPWTTSETVRDGHRIDLGGRTLEVLHVAGHAPDAAALLDRERGLLFTGDTFYDGPIYLFGEETDLGAYRRSVERLAGLVPGLELLLPGHNTPVSPPGSLVSLARALDAIERGEVEGAARPGGRVEYVLDHFTLLMSEGDGDG